MRGKTVRIALLLALLHLAVLLAGFLAPYHFAAQHRNYPYAPPSRIHFRDAGGSFHFRPFVYALVPDSSTGSYREDSRTVFPIRLLVPAREEPASGLVAFPVRLFGVDPPGVLFLFGSDGFGRDVFSRLLYGAQISLFTGLLAASLAVGIGLVCGTLAGYFGGVTDQITMRGGELFLALPWLYLLLGVRALLPLHISPPVAFLLLVGIIGGVGWVRPARLVRGVVLSARELAFVQAARAFGGSHSYVIRRHILPLTSSVLLTQMSVLIPRFVLAEVSLSFLGLGVGEPRPSWGNMLAEARQYHALVQHPWMLSPAGAMVLTLLFYLLLADALTTREHFR